MIHKKCLPVIFLLVLLLTACGSNNALSSVQLLEPEGVTYDTAIAGRDDIYIRRQFRASVKAYSEALYFTNSTLRFARMEVYCGQMVKQGDVLAVLDTETLHSQISDAQEAIVSLKSAYDSRSLRLSIDIEIAELELENMILSGLTEDTLDGQRAYVENMHTQLNQLEQIYTFDLAWQEESLQSLYADLEGTALTAPFDGRVTFVSDIKEGGYVQPYATLVEITDDSRVYVYYEGNEPFSYLESYTCYGLIGEKRYDLDFVPLDKQEFTKYLLESKVPPARLNFADSSDGLVPGTFVLLMQIREKSEDVLCIPTNSVYSSAEMGGEYVYLMVDGQKTVRPVKTGLDNGVKCEIISGLSEGDEVFVKQ